MIALKENSFKLSGNWVLSELLNIERNVAALAIKENSFADKFVRISGSEVASLDTSGGYQIILLMDNLAKKGIKSELVDFTKDQKSLLDLLALRMQGHEREKAPEREESVLARIGRVSLSIFNDGLNFLSFIGEVSRAIFANILTPWKIRWPAFWSNVQSGGVDAVPIVGLLNFLIGIVIAYQGGALLLSYGANIFVVELVSISMVREMAPLITAIIVAGRTGSAFAAQIGTMTVNEEVDALRTIGISPIDQLVIPKLFALIVALPLLTLFADILSVFGGMVLARFYLNVTFVEFVARIPEVMSLSSVMVGLCKAPIFAMIIALTGCYQGFQVQGGADSVGQQTTISVVQSIFLVIISDAIFSIITRNVSI